MPLLLLSLLGVGIFFCMFCLYQLEMEAFLYGTMLYVTILFAYLVVHYYQERQRHLNRQRFFSADTGEIGDLEVSASREAQDLWEMIRILRLRCTSLSDEMQSSRQESLNYYTTWVHQIKTPIAVMQMILQAEDTQEHRELQAELFRIEQYVEMVLTYIRLGSEEHDFVFQECNLDSLIRESIHKYAAQFVRRRIRLIYEPVNAKVLTDEKWLAFILEQLLSNAVKYTYQGSVTISVSPDHKLSVSDTGIGIAGEDLPRIFEKGFTGYNGRADKKSTGLGLYLCRRTAECLGIQIEVQSVPGEGSVFTLDLSQSNLEVE